MPEVTFQPVCITVFVPAGEWLLEAAKQAGLPVETPCGGKGTCGKCLVRIVSGRVDAQAEREPGWVLLCQTRVGVDAVVVDLARAAYAGGEVEHGQFPDHEDDVSAVPDDLWPVPGDLDFLVKRAILPVNEPRAGDGYADYDRMAAAIKKAVPCRDISLPLPVLAELPEILRENKDTQLLYALNGETLRVAGLLAGNAHAPFWGLAVDIGTTTVAMTLVDEHGQAVGSKSGYNAQIACGLDVISRINYARSKKRRLELRDKIRDTVNAMASALCKAHGADPLRIINVSIAANPTMTHMLLGIVPEYIRLSPYTPALYGTPVFTAGELGLEVMPGAAVYLSPAVGSYVGGDITSGLLCTSLAVESDEVCLFIDIGTNGEIVLGNQDFLLACACSAGPAFEGGGISCGMRASVGAVENVEIDPVSGKAGIFVIGNAPPTGICGSGMIALTAELFRTGLMDPSGRLSGDSPYIKEKRYIVTPGDANSKSLSVSEADFNNLIRAKAAVFSACRTLLKSVGMDFNDLARVYIAGGFGRYLNIKNAEEIGLIPRLPADSYHFIGNASLMGARMTLVSDKHRRRQAELAAKMTYIDLSGEPSYMDEYTAALFLPHTDRRLFM